jgi:hypothetical protein
MLLSLALVLFTSRAVAISLALRSILVIHGTRGRVGKIKIIRLSSGRRIENPHLSVWIFPNEARILPPILG